VKRWLVKSDPEEYSAEDLARDGRTVWDGVSNPLALRHLRSMSPGDEVLVYHTGDQKAVVALARVASPPRPDPRDKSSKAWVVDLEFVAPLARPVRLADIRREASLADFDLVRISRLSVMPVSAVHWNRLMKLAGGAQPGAP
jgi:predicted RNA-binding protein with PUA-like domain